MCERGRSVAERAGFIAEHYSSRKALDLSNVELLCKKACNYPPAAFRAAVTPWASCRVLLRIMPLRAVTHGTGPHATTSLGSNGILRVARLSMWSISWEWQCSSTRWCFVMCFL